MAAERPPPDPAFVLYDGRRVGADTGRPLPPVDPAYTRRMMESLRRTRPWAAVAAGFILAGTLLAAWEVLSDIDGRSDPEWGEILIPLLIFLGIADLFLGAAFYLFRYARRIKAFLRTGTTASLEEAMWAQYRCWQRVGILMILALASVPLAFSVEAISKLLK